MQWPERAVPVRGHLIQGQEGSAQASTLRLDVGAEPQEVMGLQQSVHRDSGTGATITQALQAAAPCLAFMCMRREPQKALEWSSDRI